MNLINILARALADDRVYAPPRKGNLTCHVINIITINNA